MAAAASADSKLPKSQTVVEFASKGAQLTVHPNTTVPEVGKYDVLVGVEVCGVCHSEVVPQYMSGQYPRIPGHEVIGTVLKVGSEAKRWKVGDRVGRGWHGGHCFSCKGCLKGDFAMCSSGLVCGLSDNGGYCEYMIAPWESLAKVPDGMNPIEAAPLMCAGVTTFNSMRRQHKIAGSIVAVQGIGGLGHLAVQFASKMGYTVAAITSPDKIALAKELGATHIIDTSKHPMDNKSPNNAASELQKLGGAAIIASTGFDANSQGALTGGLATDGVMLLLGIDGQKPVPVHNLSLLNTRGSVRGWYSGTSQDAEETLEFAATHGIKSFIEAAPLEKAPEMYARLLQGKPRFRISLYTKAGEKFVKPEHLKWQQTSDSAAKK